MWEFNRTERKALLLAACLIGMAALGRSAGEPSRDGLSWVAESGSPGGNATDTAAGSLRTGTRDLKRTVEAAVHREARALTPLADGEKIDPNRAPEEELRRLPGIGPTRARAIVEERTRRAFETPVEVQRVRGIGPATYARIARFLEVEWRVGEADPRPPVPSGQRCGTSGRIDVNTATESELRGLSGIGPVLAGRIVHTRTTSGRFAGPEALRGVSGIGPRLLERLANRVCYSGD